MGSGRAKFLLPDSPMILSSMPLMNMQWPGESFPSACSERGTAVRMEGTERNRSVGLHSPGLMGWTHAADGRT